MVYRGKPSAACGECRKRRTRCDQAVPACGQCVKAKRACTGYRNTTDLMFFDESSKVAKKSKSRAARLAESDSHSSSSDPDDLEDQAPVLRIVPEYAAPIRLTDMVLYQPLGDLAVNFFMTNYVSDPLTSQFDYLPAIFFRGSSSSSYSELQQIVKAVGLAGYAQATQHHELINSAMKSYVNAIRQVNLILSDPKAAGHDSTLITVMLLAMFEVMILPRTTGLENLTKHMDGAISIATMRLKQQSLTAVGRKLLGNIAQVVVMNSWIQNIPLPPDFINIKNQLDKMENRSSVHATFLDIVTELLQFREALLKKNKYHSPAAVIEEAAIIDEGVKIFMEDVLPMRAHFRGVHASTDEAELSYNGYYHVYPRNFAAHIWNNSRASRIRLHQVIISQCRKILSSQTGSERAMAAAQLAESEILIQYLVEEICATIPQLACYLEQLPSYARNQELDPKISQSPDSGGPVKAQGTTSPAPALKSHFSYSPPGPKGVAQPNDPTLAVPKRASEYHVLYHLYAICSMPTTSKNMRNWIRGRIRFMEASTIPKELTLFKEILKSRGHLPMDENFDAIPEQLAFEQLVFFHPLSIRSNNIWLIIAGQVRI
ncbi:hypothetical protein BDV95DRAFT_572258 [Massariosphaeria phaeospora]|uniref:Zn(2)-C6 fungal-type domain-containing protein n=1 Tax=Massariosphaeria phaeospora TaxID=100035 RepID=A0A7C8I5T7_9PLEO|nr:hypothetical protein BDV95DRAFT_572258 [Massariosphaeria phaeospora]